MRNYWWPEVTRDVRKYIKRCDMCQRMKNVITRESVDRHLGLGPIIISLRLEKDMST